MYPSGEKLVINGLNPQDRSVLDAASYGLKEITLNGRKDVTQIVEDLSRRTEAARSLISPIVELTTDESYWMAEAVSRKILLEAHNLEVDSSQNTLTSQYRILANFAKS